MPDYYWSTEKFICKYFKHKVKYLEHLTFWLLYEHLLFKYQFEELQYHWNAIIIVQSHAPNNDFVVVLVRYGIKVTTVSRKESNCKLFVSECQQHMWAHFHLYCYWVDQVMRPHFTHYSAIRFMRKGLSTNSL